MTDLKEAIRHAVQGKTGPADPPKDGVITWETVEAVTGQNECRVQGQTVPVTGLATFPVGARVPVAWKNGRPVAVIGHRVRRAQFHPSKRLVGVGIVEELSVANYDAAGKTIWYRCQGRLEQVTMADGSPVNSALRGATPLEVKWGLDGKSFAVAATGGLYAVFAFEREDPNALGPMFPGNSNLRLVWSGTPLAANPDLCTVNWTNSNATTIRYQTVRVSEDYYAWTPFKTKLWDYTGGGYNPDCWIWIPPTDARSNKLRVEHGWESSGEASASAAASSSESFTLQDALQGKDDGYGGSFSGGVVDWFLDASLELKFVILAAWDYYRGHSGQTATGTGYLPFGRGVDLKEPTPFSVSASGGGTPIGAKRQSDHQTVDEQHLFLLNGQTGQVEWGTSASGTSFGTRQHSYSGALMGHYLFHIAPEPSGPPGTPT